MEGPNYLEDQGTGNTPNPFRKIMMMMMMMMMMMKKE